MNDPIPALFLDSYTLTRSCDGSSLYQSFPNEQKVYGTHLLNVSSDRFLPCTAWTLLYGPTSRKSVVSALEQEVGFCVFCVWNSSVYVGLAWLVCRDSWANMSETYESSLGIGVKSVHCTPSFFNVLMGPTHGSPVVSSAEAENPLLWPLCDRNVDMARMAKRVRQTGSTERSKYEIDI